jgi:two-component system capsular synthesis response regulator RcsB
MRHQIERAMRPSDDALPISPREGEVIRFLAQGLTVSEVARRTGRSVKTISQQKRDAMRKLGLESDKQLFDYARSAGLV